MGMIKFVGIIVMISITLKSDLDGHGGDLLNIQVGLK